MNSNENNYEVKGFINGQQVYTDYSPTYYGARVKGEEFTYRHGYINGARYEVVRLAPI